MKSVPFTNIGETTAHIDGKRIEPGQTRDVDPSMIPERLRKAVTADEAEDEPVDDITRILDNNIPEIESLLPDLSDDDLAKVKAAEMAGKTRSGLMKAIGEEELRRANEKVHNPGGSASDDDVVAGD
jgi:hypothetical protein